MMIQEMHSSICLFYPFIHFLRPFESILFELQLSPLTSCSTIESTEGQLTAIQTSNNSTAVLASTIASCQPSATTDAPIPYHALTQNDNDRNGAFIQSLAHPTPSRHLLFCFDHNVVLKLDLTLGAEPGPSHNNI